MICRWLSGSPKATATSVAGVPCERSPALWPLQVAGGNANTLE